MSTRRYDGDHNPNWRGSRAGYNALHHRVERLRGKPKECSRCGVNDPTARYEWANLTGRYEDIEDYERMCVLCHRRMDAARRCPNPKTRKQYPRLVDCVTCEQRRRHGGRGHCTTCYTRLRRQGELPVGTRGGAR